MHYTGSFLVFECGLFFKRCCRVCQLYLNDCVSVSRRDFTSLKIYYTQLNYENIQEEESYGVSVQIQLNI